jgi:hypothetical protein
MLGYYAMDAYWKPGFNKLYMGDLSMDREEIDPIERLFSIRDTQTGKIAREMGYFVKKSVAKTKRDELNDRSKNRYRITFGPDHWKYRKES